MISYYSDTHSSAESLQVKLLRETPSWRKMEIFAELNMAARDLALAGLRQRYPEADDIVLRRYLANCILGFDTAQHIFEELEHRA